MKLRESNLKLSKHDESYPSVLHRGGPSSHLTVREIEYAPRYTIREIADFNSKLGYIQIFPYKNMVCCATKFRKIVVKRVKEFEMYKREMFNDITIETVDFRSEFKLSPPFCIWSDGIRMEGLQRSIKNSKVADLHCLNPAERWKDEKLDVDMVYEELKKDGTLSEYQIEYLDQLIRYRENYDKHKGVPEHRKCKRHDLNKDTFPLPHTITPDHLRPWMKQWELFDTEIPDRETGWLVLEMDVVKNDLITSQQGQVLEERAKRKDLFDSGRMRKRREVLAVYFIRKYNLNPETLIPYMASFINIHNHWVAFQQLCETD